MSEEKEYSYVKCNKFKSNRRMEGKVVLITGCNTGIGKETVRDLAGRGAKIYMACRDSGKCEEARQEIIQETKNEEIFNRSLDLSSLDSIRQFVSEFKKEEPLLDVLINNAGVMMCPRSETKDGFELQLGTNHMGHFLLTNLLLDQLKKAEAGRIVIVSSAVHSRGKLNKDDLNSENSYSKYDAYFQSKLANVLFMRELAKRLEGTSVTANACHPGAVKTDLQRHMVGGASQYVLDPLMSVFFKTPKSGAQTQIRLAVDPELEKVSGKYFGNCKIEEEAPQAKSDEDALWLWNESAKWTKLEEAKELE